MNCRLVSLDKQRSSFLKQFPLLVKLYKESLFQNASTFYNCSIFSLDMIRSSFLRWRNNIPWSSDVLLPQKNWWIRVFVPHLLLLLLSVFCCCCWRSIRCCCSAVESSRFSSDTWPNFHESWLVLLPPEISVQFTLMRSYFKCPIH